MPCIHAGIHKPHSSFGLLRTYIIIFDNSFCLHNNDGSDDNAVKVGLMLQGQKKKTFEARVNDNVSSSSERRLKCKMSCERLEQLQSVQSLKRTATDTSPAFPPLFLPPFLQGRHH